MKQKKNIIQIIKESTHEPFWETETLDFELAFIEFMDFKEIEVYSYELREGKHEEILEDGITKIRSVLKLESEQLEIHLKAYQDGQWLYEFEEVADVVENNPNYVKGIHQKRIVSVNGVDCVLLVTNIASEDIKVYAIPIDIAQELNIPTYDNEDIDKDEDFLEQISEFEIDRYIVHNVE